MESLILLLSKILLFLSTVILAGDENPGSIDSLTNEGRLTDDIIPLHYKLNLDLSNTLISNSECHITILINHPTRKLSLYVDRLQIREFKFLSIKSIENSTEETGPTHYVYNKEAHIITYIFTKELYGNYTLHLLYANVKNTEIFFKIPIADDDGKRAWLLGINLWPMGARQLLPCWDEPTFPANFSINIKHYTNYIILSNMPIQEWSTTDELNIIWTHFVTTPRIPTSHVSAILLPKFYFETVSTLNIHMERRQQLNLNYIKYAYFTLNEIIKYLKEEKTYLILNSEMKISHVLIPGFQYNAVSNFGLIFYREMDVILDEKKDPLMRRIDIAYLLGRSVAYQCMRNRFGPTSWTYMWLNQGISTLLAMDAIDKVYPFYQIKDLFVVQTVQESLRLDTNSIMKPLVSEIHRLSDINSIHFFFACHIKGPVILRMLQHMLQEDVFQNGINKYLKYDSYSETNIKVFWTAMQAAYDEHKSNVGDFNVKDAMEAWMTEEHYPVLNVTQYSDFVEITMYNVNINKKKWWIPYTATTKNALNFSLPTQKMLNILIDKDKITYEELHIYDKRGEWVMVNLQQIGYYRVNYDAKSLKNIRNSLNSDEYTNIHVLNRAQLMDDAFHFLLEGQLDLSVFENLTTYLWSERNYVAWYPVFKAFEYLSSFLVYGKHFFDIKSKVISILDHLYQQIGYEEKEIIPKLFNEYHDSPYYLNSLKQETARWTCVFGSFECRKRAYIKLKTDLSQNNNRILPWWKEWTYCNGLITADNVTWDKVFNMYIEKPDATLLKFLACSEDFSIIRKYLGLIASRRYAKVIKDDGRIYIFHSVIARHAKNDTILDYILANFDKVRPRKISTIIALVDIINHVYSEDSLYKIYKFMEMYVTTQLAKISELSLMIGVLLCDEMKPCKRNILNQTILETNMNLKIKLDLRSSQIIIM